MAGAKKGRKAIPKVVQVRLWTASGGRCEFDGCNKSLWRNDLTMGEMNTSYIAHIYAYSPSGPRYDRMKSPILETEFSNLMLLCDTCHRTIDNKKLIDIYTAEKLIEMKRNHEDRIELLTSLQPNKKSHIILYGAKIGQHSSPLNMKDATVAILPDYYPASPNAIELGFKNSSFQDADDNYWSIESKNLNNLFKERVESVRTNQSIQHYSIFPLAPQPLLISLGTMLGDIYTADTYQLHREPQTWEWHENIEEIEYIVEKPYSSESKVALKLALSASISDDRILKVLGENVSIWSITIPSPNNDFLKSKKQLEKLRKCYRKVFDKIKLKHGEKAELHVFPAMPVAAAVEFGRVWMPKADLPFYIYDQNRAKEGFSIALEIK